MDHRKRGRVIARLTRRYARRWRRCRSSLRFFKKNSLPRTRSKLGNAPLEGKITSVLKKNTKNGLVVKKKEILSGSKIFPCDDSSD